jgi:hypothetical protein
MPKGKFWMVTTQGNPYYKTREEAIEAAKKAVLKNPKTIIYVLEVITAFGTFPSKVRELDLFS